MTRRPPGVTRSHKIQTLPKPERPTREDALRAVETLIRWAGADPSREGLLGTPDRVVKSYAEFFEGYAVGPLALLARTFEEGDGYDELVLRRALRFDSHKIEHAA